MKKLYKLILVIALILLLSGCKSAIDLDDYYYTKAKLEGTELNSIVLEGETVMLDNTRVYVNDTDFAFKSMKAYETYQYSYKNEYIFNPITTYWYCNSGDCNRITEDEYNNIG